MDFARVLSKVARRQRGTLARYLALCCSILFSASSAYSASLVIGGFDKERGGYESLGNSHVKSLRDAIYSAFPGSQFLLRQKLSARFLANVDVVVLGVAYGDEQAIAPLTAHEQRALVQFVQNGGVALLFCDNKVQFHSASNSLIKQFGLQSAGVVSAYQTAPFLTLAVDPIANGPFGSATQLDTVWPGWFSKLGSATELAELAANGKPEIAYLPAGSLTSGSGAVVFFADSNPMFYTANDQVVILNAVALAIPAPPRK